MWNVGSNSHTKPTCQNLRHTILNFGTYVSNNVASKTLLQTAHLTECAKFDIIVIELVIIVGSYYPLQAFRLRITNYVSCFE